MTLCEKIKEYDIKEMAAFLVGIKAGMLVGAEPFDLDVEIKRMVKTLSEEE